MREGILRIMFVGDTTESCSAWKEKFEGLTVGVNNVEKIEVHTGMQMDDIHNGLMEMGSMPHLFLVEPRAEFEHNNVAKNLKMMLPLSSFALVVSRGWDKRILQAHVIAARQGNDIDYFVADDSSDDELAEMLDVVVRTHFYQKKALEPLRYLLERKIE